MKDSYRRAIIIGIAIAMILIFHEIIPIPYRYLADFIGGFILGFYWRHEKR